MRTSSRRRAPSPSASRGRARSSPAPTTGWPTAACGNGRRARHRKGGGDRLGRWIAALFIVGSGCFAAGSLPGYSSLVGERADAITYFVGSIFRTPRARGVPAICVVLQRHHFTALDASLSPRGGPGRVDAGCARLDLLPGRERAGVRRGRPRVVLVAALRPGT